ncbi:MAG: 16S rRNA (cytosine(1402)-N(4))-methyltransferase RsmH [Lentisphaerae bacterium]|nr:16S rRNA (cytosine(1402)-N(4))-methyltransferase RsmH [Lentisphaerota bacterium]
MHQAVLLTETVERLNPRPGGIYIDATVGSAGHAAAIVERMEGQGLFIGMDRDPEALARAGERLAEFGAVVRLVHANFSGMEAVAREAGVTQVDGIMMDLGVSSNQIGTPERGFSFQDDGPLDMRMDPTQPPTAAELVNTLSEFELADCFRTLGEEKRARVAARAIVRERSEVPITTTGRLAAIVEKAVGGRRGRIHPATRVFQALRMRVNGELDALAEGLDAGISLLAPGGRLAVISFHSLEDRMVKHCFARHIGRMVSLAAGGEAWEGTRPKLKAITRKPVMASEAELAENPRARSAKLRVIEAI